MTATASGVDDKVSLSGATMTGNLNLQGTPPLTIPSGAGSGLVWTSDSAGNGSWQAIGTGFTATTVKTSAYTAHAAEFVPVDATSGSVTITLPTAPADKTIAGVKMINTASGHTVTVAAGPGDVFNKAGGATTETLSLLNQGMLFQYSLSTGIWYVQADDLTLSQLDARYNSTAATVINVRNAAYGAKGDNVTDDTTAIQNALNAAGAGDTVYVPYTSAGYLCGTLVIPPGVTFLFDANAKLVAPSSLAAGWITLTPSVVHTGTKILNGTFDATAVTSASCFAVIECNGYTSCPDLLIDGNRVINAPKHGIFVGGEATYTLDKKWVTRNVIDEHGVVGVGFGIYADFSANVEISSNYVYTAGVDDSIELGHSGPHWLTGGIDGHLTCDRNVVVGGQIQFPFSDYARITNNIVINNGIQNDNNTANYVTIIGNTVFNSTPGSGYAGINVNGDRFTIANNRVQVTTLGGIHSSSTTGSKILGNDIESLSAVGNAGSGIAIDGGSDCIIRDNTIWGTSAATSATNGGFHYGIGCGAANSLISGNRLLATVGTSIADESTASGNVYTDNDCTAVFQPAPTLNGTAPVFRNNPGLNTGVITKTGAYTAKPYDFCILGNATSAGFTITLPTAAGVTGQQYIVKKTDSSANAVTIGTTSSQTIDGATTQTLASQWASLNMVSDGSNWQTVTSAGGGTLDTTATDYKNIGTALAAGSTGKAADAGHVHSSSQWMPADVSMLAWAYDPALAQGATTHLGTAGLVYAIAVPVRQTISVTNIVVYLSANGATLTSGQCFAALYPGAGGALIAQTADQSTAWGSGAVKAVTMPLSGGPYSVSAGIVYVALWYNGTTGPAFADAGTSGIIVNPGGVIRYGSFSSGVTTTAPGTLGSLTANIASFWVALS